MTLSYFRGNHCGLKQVFLPIATALCFASCDTIDLYEKNVVIPDHEWQSNHKPSFTFTIKDTTAPYQVYLVLRHNERYSFNNIWLNFHIQSPLDTISIRQIEKTLANNQGWLGRGMDDVYEHRLPMLDRPQLFVAGQYTFTLEQIMRQDPLENIMNVGIRVEKTE